MREINSCLAASQGASARSRDVTLIAVTKTRSAEEIAPLIAAGQRDFGESRVQEAAAEMARAPRRASRPPLHMIGRLQSNKAAEAVALFDTIHSLDRPSLARRAGRGGAKAGKFPDCFVQVNIGEEEQKGGVAPPICGAFLAQVRASPLPLAGLMCIPPAGPRARAVFRVSRRAGAAA